MASGIARWTNQQRRDRMAHRHGLASPSEPCGAAATAAMLVGLHSSDPVTVYLSVAARCPTATVDSIQGELVHLVRHHAMRRTLWVFNQQTASMAHAACTAKIAVAERKKLIKALVDTSADNAPKDPEAWLTAANAAVLAALEDGPTSTRDLGQRLPDYRILLDLAPGKSYGGTQSALTRVLLVLGFEGLITRTATVGGGWTNSQYLWALTEQTAATNVSITSDTAPTDAQAWMAQRWLSAFGPAPATDLQWWMGWTATATRHALAAAEAVEVELEDGSTGWLNPDDREPPAPTETWTAALPGLDPTTMGWKQRDWYLESNHVAALFDRNGNAGPTLWVDGRIVGGWVQLADGTLDYRLLTKVSSDHRQMLEDQLTELQGFIGETRFKVRFPAPLQRELFGSP